MQRQATEHQVRSLVEGGDIDISHGIHAMDFAEVLLEQSLNAQFHGQQTDRAVNTSAEHL